MATPDLYTRLIAFSNNQCVAEGMPEQVVTDLKSLVNQQPESKLIILDAATSRTVEIDFRESPSTILAKQFRPAEPTPSVAADQSERETKRGRGRPKLGVVSKEVTLLPRHWDWLSKQPGGISVALRKLVEEARRGNAEEDQRRSAENSAYRFMTVLAGDAPGYEEAIRSLYAGDLPKLLEIIENWPSDVARHTESLARDAIC